MKRTLLPLALALIAAQGGAAAGAETAANCDATYVTHRGDSLKRIVASAYAAPMLPIVLAQNPHIDRASQRLPAGLEIYLPCLHNLPQFTPRIAKAGDIATYRIALR